MKRHPIVPLTLSFLLLFTVLGHAADDPGQLFEQGVAAFNEGNYEEAVSFWEQALPLYKKSADAEHEAMILNNIGLVRFHMRQYDEAIGYFTGALAIDRKRGISKDITTDLQNLGMAYSALRDYGPALSAFKEAADIADSVGDLEGRANNLYRIGITEYALGNYPEAGTYFIAASDLHRGLRDRSGYALDIMGLGDVYAALDRFDKAVENYQEALKVREVIGEIEPYINTKIKIARTYANNGRYEEGLEYLAQARKDAETAKSEPLLGEIALARGDILNWSGDASGALASYDEALVLMKKVNDLSGAGMVLTNQGILESEVLRFSEAVKSFEDARLIYQVNKDPRNEAKVLINLGNLTGARGDLDGALSYYSEADALLSGDRGGAVSGVNYLAIGEIYLKKKEFKKARSALEKAGKLLAGETDGRYNAKIDAYLGVLEYYESNYSSSVARFNAALTILRKENTRSLVADILVGTGMALMSADRPEVASGYFTEAKRLADDLVLAHIGWRAVYGDGLLKEKAGDTETAAARYKEALFRLSGMPDIAPTIYGSGIVTTDDLFGKLLSSATADGQDPDARLLPEGFDRIVGLFTEPGQTHTPKEEALLARIKNAAGEVNYLEKRLAEDEFRKGTSTDRFTKKLLSAQGEYLTALDDVRKKAPGLWDTYFKAVYGK